MIPRRFAIGSIVLLAALAAAGRGEGAERLVFNSVAPCRIIDTRSAVAGVLAANETRTFHVVGSTSDFRGQGGQAGGCGLPGFAGPGMPQVQAVLVNFVAVSAAGAGDLKGWASDDVVPTASIINYAKVTDQTLPGVPLNIANGIGLPVRQDVEGGDISIRADVSSTHVVADVVGYWRFITLPPSAVGTAELADGSVTAAKIANGTVVRTLNGQTDAVTLTGTNGLGVSQGGGTVTVTSNATPANAAGTIVARDGAGSFGAGSITLSGNLDLPNSSASAGLLTKAGTRFLHNSGTSNTFVGANAGNTTTTGGGFNTGAGANALTAVTTGAQNAAFGSNTLRTNTTGSGNAGFGTGALLSNTTGSFNSAFGVGTLLVSNTASFNSAFGFQALDNNTTGSQNTGLGSGAVALNSTGIRNVGVGSSALVNMTSGDRNVAVGMSAGFLLSTGSDNIYVGSDGPPGGFPTPESNAIRIGNAATQTATFIAGISGATSASGVAVLVNASGQLGTTTSSRRFKDDIGSMAGESDVLMKLRPVAFYYKPEYDATHTRQYGLVAEDVARVAPQLVVFDEEGAPQTVRYHFVNAMLLNEVQKQRRQVEEQGGTIARQQAEIQELVARLARLEAKMASGRAN